MMEAERRPDVAAIPHHHFHGLGAEAADKIIAEAGVGPRVSPGKLTPADVDQLHQAMQNVNLSDGQIDERAALRQPRAAAISGGGLRHHANRDGNQLAGLRPEPVARLDAQRAGDRHGPHG